MALVAQRDISIGDHVIGKGEVVPADVQAILPAGRVEQLKAMGRVQEIAADTAENELAIRVDQLEARLSKIERGTQRAPARKRGGA